MPWVAVPLGLLTGLVMGALGGGGAILTIPALVFLLGQDPHTATTEALLVVDIGALAGSVGPLRGGQARAGPAALLALAGLPGTYAGSRLSAAVAPSVLLVLLAALLVVVAGLMLRHRPDAAGRGPGSPRDGARTSHGQAAARAAARPHPVAVALVGVGVGALTGFFGVGGGFAIVPALTLVLGYPMADAVGTSLLVIALNSATALVARLGHGVELDWWLVALFAAGAALGSIAGGRLARRASPETLTRGFGLLLLAIAAYMLVDAVVRH